MLKSLKTLLIFSILLSSLRSFSQFPACPNGLVYLQNSPIQQYNPLLPVSATNPSNVVPAVPSGGGGLAYGPNIFAPSPSPTFYTTIGTNYAYYNGSAWITTTVTTGNASAVNIGSGPGCMYNLVGFTGEVYVTNGSGPSTLLTTISTFNGGGPYDMVVDNCCNFYLLNTTTPGQSLTCYSPSGAVMCTWSLAGMPSISAGGGFAIVGNQVVVANTGGLWVGNMSPTQVTFTNVSTTVVQPGDYACCPLSCGPLTATAVNTSSSSPIGCSGGTANVIVTSTTSPLSYTWSGPGIVSGVNSATAVVNQCGVYTATVTKAGCPPGTTVVTTSIACATTFTPTASISNSLSCTQPSANVTASPGPAGYTYTWTGPGIVGSTSTDPITANVGGVYTATVMNTVTGCKGTVSINLPANLTTPPLTVTPTPTAVCLGGSQNLTVSGANTYTWSPGATLNTTNGPNVVSTPVANTTYTVVGTVGICTVATTAVVNINPQPSGVLSFTNATCGLNNGVIYISNTSGPGQTITSYSLNGGPMPTQTVTALAAGNYTVTMVNNFGCRTNYTISLSNSPAITALVTTVINATCGNNNGAIGLGVPAGGVGPYTYNVNGGPFSTSPTLTNLAAGTYTIGVMDSKGCTFFKNVTIINSGGPTALNFTTTPNSCVGSAGSVTIGVTGGTPAYTYTIDATASASTASGLTTGIHNVTVKDANGCAITGTFNIGVVTGPASATVATSNAACGNANGSATVIAVAGGLAPYQYSFNGGPFSTTSFTAGLISGSYTVVVRDANSCTLTVNYIVNNTGSPVSVIGGVVNVSCFGGSNGSFTVNTAGGTPGYSYTLTPTNATSGSGVFAGLTAQPYSVNVKDAAGCVTTVTVNITQPTALTLTLTPQPAKCNGSTNGTITAAGSGGTGPYTFDLNGGPFQASGTFTGVGAAIYNVTIKDNNGCTLTQSVQVTQPTPITLTLTSANANCTAANGTASVTAAGGTPFYNYSWTGGGGTSAGTNPLATGVYSVTVTDANGCTKTGSISINSTPGGTAVISSSVQPTCMGFNNGSMTAGFTGAMSAPISYSWSNGQTTQTATNLLSGGYTVTLTDAFGCTSSVTGFLNQPAALDMLPASTSVTCYGGNNGTGTAIYNGGGTPPLTFLWAPGGATTATAPTLSAGVYSVTTTDSKGCTLTMTVNITQPSSVTITNTVTTANCNQSNGSATITAIGGAGGPYTYTWSTGSNSAALTGVAAGTYTVIVKDANGCSYNSAATVPNSAGPSLAITGFTNVSCFGGNNGIATTSVSGGTGPYVYLWSNGQVTGTGTNLLAGIYSATVTDANGCKASASVTVTQPTALALIVSGTDPKCFNATNGSANAGVSGGTPGYTYNWVPSGSTAQSPVGLGPGNHLVTVTDANGCIINGSVTLNNPAQMTAAVTSTNVTCNGSCNGMANGSAANTVGAVIYFWTGGPGPLTTQNITNLCPGTYTLLATDANNCTAQALTTITQPPLLTASITASGNPSCATYTNGFATAAPAGGTPGYTYSWSPGGGTGSTANGLGAGSYTATITDSKGCTANANVTITQPTPLAATITSTNVTCFGLNNGIGNVAYSGGTGPYTFLWFPTLNNTPSVGTLPPGTHTIQITDNLGCITTLTTTITQPPTLTAVISSTNSNCTQANGQSCVTAGGGAGGYTYQWTSNPLFTNSCINNVVAGAYTVTVTDVNGCTINAIANINDIAGPSIAVTATTAVSCFGGSNGSASTSISGGTGTISVLWSYLAQTTQNVNNLPAGLHSITITDAAGCVASTSVQITQPTQLTSAITNVTNVTCSGSSNGSATMLVNGGTPGYTYLWTPSAQSSSMAVSMGPGIYTCSVTDANGCPTSQTVNISQPNPLTITSASVTNLTCNGNNTGQINTTISGGSPAYIIVWSPAQPPNAVITNLAAGTYSLLVTDTKSCTTTGVYVVTEPAALTSLATATPATCGNANGSATVTVNGGTPGYTYNWNTPTIQTTPAATGMSPNTWSCTVTDSKGCIITQSVNVPNAPGPTLSSMSFTAPLCFGQQNGSMAINFTSGTGPFGIIWNNPSASITQTVNGVGAGVYSATVTDTYGCTTNGVINVTQPNILLLNVNANPTICFGQFAQIYAAGSGGTPAYSYTWNPSSLTGPGPHTETPTVTTSYIVSVSDANGCVTNPKTIIINVKPQLLATGGSTTVCHNKPATLIPNITSPGNGGPYTYNWTGGSTSSNITVNGNYPTTPNMYTVNISDGCSSPNATATFTVNVNPLPSGYFTANVLKGCSPLAVTFSATSNSSTDIYNWALGGGAGGQAFGTPVNNIYTDPGMYSISMTIVNAFGCTKDSTAISYIEVYPVPIAEFTADPWEGSLLDPVISFTNLSVGATSYFWDFGDIDSPLNNTTVKDPSHAYELASVYKVWLVAFNDKGCKDTVMHTVEIIADYALYIPNTFTPDGNGLNDIFQPKGVGIDESSYKMYIFDRWGELIFTSDEFRKGWDGTVKSSGKQAEQGVYVYKIFVKDIMGNVHPYVGHVNCLPRQQKVD